MRYYLSLLFLTIYSLTVGAADVAYGPVANGETLWEIATKVNKNKETSRYSVVLALLYENPKSFAVSCNFNSLKLAAIIYVPNKNLIAQLDRKAAVKEVKRQEKAWKEHRRGHRIKCEPTPLKKAWLQIKKITLNKPALLETLNQLSQSANQTTDTKSTTPKPVIAQVPQALPDSNPNLGEAFPNANNAHVLVNLQWGVHLNTILLSLNLGLSLFLGLLIWRSLQQQGNQLNDINAKVESQHSDEDSNISIENLHHLVWLFMLFLGIGFSVMGGFMALVHKIQQKVGKQHQLLSDKELIDGIALASFLPGSIAINLSSYVGFRLRGSIGALVCSIGLILPSILLAVLLSYIYFEWGQQALIKEAFIGLIPAITAIIFHAAWVFSYKSVQDPATTLLAVAAAVIMILLQGVYGSIIIILVAALAGILLFKSHMMPVKTEINALNIKDKTINPIKTYQLNTLSRLLMSLFLLSVPVFFYVAIHNPDPQTNLLNVISNFLGLSLLSVGGHFTFIPLAQDILISNYQWLTQTEFASVMAMGQLLPETFFSGALIVYKIAGISGVILAAIALSLPPIILTILATESFENIKKAPLAQAALLGIRAAVIGMIFASALLIGQTAVLHWGSLVIFTIAMFMLFHWHIKTVWVVLFALVMGIIVYSLPNIPFNHFV